VACKVKYAKLKPVNVWLPGVCRHMNLLDKNGQGEGIKNYQIFADSGSLMQKSAEVMFWDGHVLFYYYK